MQRLRPVGLRAVIVAATIAITASSAVAQTINVSGSANPNLAGRASGYTCCSGDAVPGQAPPFISVSTGSFLTFAVTGFSDYNGSPASSNNPDGNENASLTNYGDGISAPTNVRYNGLFGVFLGSASPTGMSTPARLDFGAGLNFASLAPGIAQIFFIGDGLTTDSNLGQSGGASQRFTVPTGATRLFFGSGDGFGWFNNSGSFSVTTTSTPTSTPTNTVPEPTTMVLFAAGLAALGLKARRRSA